jgi:hypothetical protein
MRRQRWNNSYRDDAQQDARREAAEGRPCSGGCGRALEPGAGWNLRGGRWHFECLTGQEQAKLRDVFPNRCPEPVADTSKFVARLFARTVAEQEAIERSTMTLAEKIGP